MTDAATESRIAAFLARYTPEIAAQAKACRAALRRLIPRGHELVYDNYNALVFGYAPTPKTSTAVLSIAAYPRWITLFFRHGTTLNDPQSLLEGSASQVRRIRLQSSDDLDRPAVRSLIAAALGPCAADFAQAGPLTTVVKSVAARQRPRRPPAPTTKTATPGPARQDRC
jgi:hypothetical protein